MSSQLPPAAKEAKKLSLPDPDARELYRDGERRVYAFNDVTQFSTQGSADPPFIILPSAGKEYDPLLRPPGFYGGYGWGGGF